MLFRTFYFFFQTFFFIIFIVLLYVYDGTGFEGSHGTDGSNKGFGDGFINFGPPFYPLEFILRDAVGSGGNYIGRVGHETSVVVDYPFITSRSTASSVECGEKLIEVLEKGLTRHNW